MQTLQALIMGFFQGLTEFLPVSSSGHIVLSSAVYKLVTGVSVSGVNDEEIFFDILVHLSTLFAVIIYFFKDIKTLFCGFFYSLLKRKFEDEKFKFGIYILTAAFVTSFMGLFIKDFAHIVSKNPYLVCIMLAITGCILFASEKFHIKDKKINFKTALIIGFAQGAAILPGISRSGMTISAGLLNGVNRIDAAKFSFILSIPIIILASVLYPLITFDFAEIKNFNTSAILIGMTVSFITGYFCIKYFMKFLEKRNLKCFAYYCFSASIIFALIFAFYKN